MTIELIYDLDCPNVAAARSQLIKAFARVGVAASWTEWDRSSTEIPSHARMYGSPTILVNGRDVAGEAPREDSTCCRLYHREDGGLQGIPPIDAIAAALEPNGASRSPIGRAGGSAGWKSSLATIPGIAFAFLPKLACPACWPAYAGVLSSVGLGFLIDTKYLLPLTAAFLVVAVGALAFRARARRGYGPFIAGVVSAIMVLVGKFRFDADAAMYGGIGLLVLASLWNAWPLRSGAGCQTCVTDPPKTSTQESPS